MNLDQLWALGILHHSQQLLEVWNEAASLLHNSLAHECWRPKCRGEGSSNFTSHLSIPGLVPRPSVQIMIRALRILIQVVNEPGGICDGDLMLFRFSSRGIARCRCCRFSLGLRHVLIPEILILHGAGNCRIGGNCLLLYSLHLGEGSRQLYMNVCQPAVAALWCCREAAHRSLLCRSQCIERGTTAYNQIKHWNLITHLWQWMRGRDMKHAMAPETYWQNITISFFFSTLSAGYLDIWYLNCKGIRHASCQLMIIYCHGNRIKIQSLYHVPIQHHTNGAVNP